MPNTNDLLRDHVSLEVEYMDRIYPNGYPPTLQLPGQLISFLVGHRKQKIPLPTLLHRTTQQFVQDVNEYAEENAIPIVHFEHGQRRVDVTAKIQRRYPGRDGVVFIGIAQGKAYAFQGCKKDQKGHVGFDYSHQSVFANRYCFLPE